MRLVTIKEIKGKITLLSGMAIGGDSGNIEIGGNDNPIIRNPITKEPYIPGSSLKGKMRSLMEWYLGSVDSRGYVHNCSNSDCKVCRIFGRSAGESSKESIGPTRIVVRDAYLTPESSEKLQELKNFKGTDTEIKYENSINRITSKASPRNLERVPAGVEFGFSISYKIFDINDGGKVDENNLHEIKKALKLLELDGIGGGVSRGNGHIKLDVEIDGEKVQLEDIEL